MQLFINLVCRVFECRIFSVIVGQVNQGRKSLPANTLTQKSRVSTNPGEEKLSRDTFNGRKSLSAIPNVKQSQPLFSGLKSLPATIPAKNGTKARQPAKLAAKTKLDTRVNSSLKRSMNAGNNFSATAKETNKREPIGGRKSVLPPSTLNNSKTSRPLKSTANTTSVKPASGGPPFQKNRTQFNTQKSGATKNTHNLQTTNFKSGATSSKKTAAKPRRSILKPHTEEKNNIQIGTTILEENEDDSKDVANKENSKGDRIEIIKQTSKSVHFISPCTTPRIKTPGRATPIKTPTKDPSMR